MKLREIVLMSRVFFPIRTIQVPATTPPHPSNTTYQVSYGHEHWDDMLVAVYKVQIAYDGHVSGRKSPSYPDGTDDLLRVLGALVELRKGGGGKARGKMFPARGEIFGNRGEE